MASQTVVQGIDISQWQGSGFDWDAWRGKVGFAMAKAVEGDNWTDPDFARNWESMWQMQPDHRFVRFAYSFFHPAQDPIVQAAHLVATVRGHGLLPGDNFVCDLEVNDGLAPVVVAQRAAAFLHEVNSLAPGHRVLVYSFPAFIQAGNCAGLNAWRLWLADYGVPAPTAPQPWDRACFWQYTSDPIDGDRFMGTEDELLAFTRMPDRR
jgi:GH25 family lysozyme M1 (1,4-beta-N-acetylmuramidase)